MKCDPGLEHSCSRCIQVGNEMRAQGVHSRLYEVSNVFYQDGAWFFGTDESHLMECGKICYPSWESWPMQGAYQWYEYENQARNRVRPNIACTPSNTNYRPAVLVRWLFPTNVHHFYTDTIFTTFMTVGTIAKVLGCSGKCLQVYSIAGSTRTVLPEIWQYFFGDIVELPASNMKGCYKTVFYGHFTRSVPKVDLEGMIYDPTLRSWMHAFHRTLRSGLVPAEVLSKPTDTFLLVQHNRAPPWFNNLDWSLPDVEIEEIDFMDMPFVEQVSRVAVARGMIGVAGSGMAHQVFMRPRSLLFYTAVFEAQQGDSMGKRCCQCRMDKNDPNKLQAEGAALCYLNNAIHVGHTVLMFRWCRPDIFDDQAGFSSEQGKEVFNLLLSVDKENTDSSLISGCLVLDSDPNSPGWPRCDQTIEAPVPKFKQSPETYGPYGFIGHPYSVKDNSTFVPFPDKRVKFIVYCGGQERVDQCLWHNVCRR